MSFRNMDAWKAAMKKFAKQNNIKISDMQQRYILDEFASKISKSPYRDSLVLKGGFIVSNLLGIDSRTTKDIDLTFNSRIYSREEVQDILNDIVNVDDESFFKFEIMSIDEGQVDDGYNGFTVMLNAIHERTSLKMKLDISNNTLIFPRAIQFSFENKFTGENIGVMSYCVENIIAEKFETTLDRGEFNTRMRDLFDVVMLMDTQKHLLNSQLLSECIIEVSKERGTLENLYNFNVLLSDLVSSPIFNKNFELYKQKTYPYSDLTLDTVFNVFSDIYGELKTMLPGYEKVVSSFDGNIISSGERIAKQKRDADKQQALAEHLDAFYYEYDFYDYSDNLNGTREDSIVDLAKNLSDKKFVSGVIDFLHSAIEEMGQDNELTKEAELLLDELQSLNDRGQKIPLSEQIAEAERIGQQEREARSKNKTKNKEKEKGPIQ